jgi:5-methylcytosine-specific restriction endonuclease McrA
MAVTKKMRLAVFERDSFRCTACPRQGEEYCQPHHRKNRGAGGDNTPLSNGFQNLITLCAFCNGSLEGTGEYAESGRLNGWKVRQKSDIVGTAVYYSWAREWRLLDAWGGFTVVDRGDAPQTFEGMDF